MYKRSLLLVASVSLGLGLCSSAKAQEASPFSGSAAVVSDYLFRGLSQTNRKPAIQAGFDYAHASGFYAGIWGSSISWLGDIDDVSSGVELDFFAGYSGSIGESLSYDVGVLRYQYPGEYPAGFTSANTTEGYLSIGFRTLTLKYSRAFSNAFGFDNSKGSDYVELGWEQPLAERWTATAHVGHQRIDGFGDASYTDWNIGAAIDLGQGFSLGATYSDTNAEQSLYTNAYGKNLAKQAVVLSLSKSF